MSIIECALAAQTSGGQTPADSTTSAWYLVIALLAAVTGLVVLIFIRTSGRRATKR
jgi:hypothetical protein